MPGEVIEPRPLLKWAGGKRQLLPQLRDFYPQTFGRYYEPFLGSGAVFFDLWNQGRLDGRHATLSDDNSDLIGMYLRVRDSVGAIIEALDRLARGHARDGREHYFAVRDRRFNPARRRWREDGGTAATYPAELAAMLLYLNRTGYNGLFRLNLDGEFNVPPGRYAAPQIVDADRLRAVARVLSSANVTIAEAAFQSAVRGAQPGDLVYFDPPYAPLSATSNFRSYTARGFDQDDQRRLRDLVVELASGQVSVLLSNSTAESVEHLYERDARVRAAGLRCVRLLARRAINSRGEGRGLLQELLVTNVSAPRVYAPGSQTSC